MLSIDNPSKSNIYRFTKTDQKFSIYINRDTESFVVWFHVNDYYGKNNKKKSQRSYKTFKSREEAITWATRVCELLPKKFVGQHEKIKDIVKYGKIKMLSRKEIHNRVRDTMLRLIDHEFITSHTVLVEAGLETPDKIYNDKVYRACSNIRRNNDKYGIKTTDRGKPHRDFSNGRHRPAQIFKVEGKL